MSGGPKRNPDSLNTFGVVVVGICGAVMVYVAITALQAFYMNDTSELQTMADYGGQDTTAKGHKADEMQNITVTGSNPVTAGGTPTYHVKIDQAMHVIADEASKPGFDPTKMIPALPPSVKPTIKPIFGRPQLLNPPAAPAAGSAAAPAAGSAAAPAAEVPTGGVTPSSPSAPAPGPAAATGSGGHAP
jgi:hypothetical protein